MRGGLAALAMMLAAAPAPAKTGDLLSQEPVRPPLPYADWFARAFSHRDMPLDPVADLRKARAYYTPALYEALARQTDITADRIAYESDGLRIAGFLVRPRHAAGRLPVILWCPGGDGTVLLDSLLIMSNWARAGYAVVATTYRGGPRSEGRDEIGGADVDDVLALAPLVRSLPGVDADRLFIYGQSRGGMEAYRAMASGLPVRAAAVNSGVTDMSWNGRPDAADLDAMNRAAMPDYASEAANHFCRRSAICWPEKLHAPLLLLHGGADWRVPAAQAIDLAARLDSLHRPYSLHIVEGGAHVWLDQDQAAIDHEVLAFFRAHGGA